MSAARVQTWELWFPEAAANGLLFARARIDPATELWVHAAPETLAVTVRDERDVPVARGEPLRRSGLQLPMTRLSVANGVVSREDRWPTESDVGKLVLLPGGEVGRLLGWTNAADGSEWRWQVEFYNHR